MPKYTTLNKIEMLETMAQKYDDSSERAEQALLAMWTEFADETGDTADRIESFDESTIDMMFQTPSEAIRACCYGDVGSYMDTYCRINAYGNLVSFNTLFDDNSPYVGSALAEWIDDEGKAKEYAQYFDMLMLTEDDYQDDDEQDDNQE